MKIGLVAGSEGDENADFFQIREFPHLRTLQLETLRTTIILLIKLLNLGRDNTLMV
jgi:hypothetical protein